MATTWRAAAAIPTWEAHPQRAAHGRWLAHQVGTGAVGAGAAVCLSALAVVHALPLPGNACPGMPSRLVSPTARPPEMRHCRLCLERPAFRYSAQRLHLWEAGLSPDIRPDVLLALPSSPGAARSWIWASADARSCTAAADCEGAGLDTPTRLTMTRDGKAAASVHDRRGCMWLYAYESRSWKGRRSPPSPAGVCIVGAVL